MQTDQHLPNIRDDRAPWTPRPTLGGTDYASPEVCDEEREKIWWGDWVCVGRTEEVPSPGDYIVRDIAGESIFITRNDAGRAARLLQRLQPPRHEVPRRRRRDGTARARPSSARTTRGRYDLNGQLIGSPNVKEDEHFDRSDYPLYGFAVDKYAGLPLREPGRGAEPHR